MTMNKWHCDCESLTLVASLDFSLGTDPPVTRQSPFPSRDWFPFLGLDGVFAYTTYLATRFLSHRLIADRLPPLFPRSLIATWISPMIDGAVARWPSAAALLAWPLENPTAFLVAVSTFLTFTTAILAILETAPTTNLFELPQVMPPVRSGSRASEQDNSLPFPGHLGPDGRHQTCYLVL